MWPSPRPSPAATWVLLTGDRSAGEGARRGGAAVLGADRLHQPTRGRWGLEVGRGWGVEPEIRLGGLGPIEVVWVPIGSIVGGQVPSGADTEVRPPARLVFDPFGGLCGAIRTKTNCWPVGPTNDLLGTFPGPLGRAGGTAGPLGRELVWGAGVNRANHEPATANTTRVAGGRTSVSAPLGLGPQTTERWGRQTTWIGQAPPAAGRSNRTLQRQPVGRARGVSPRQTTRPCRPHPGPLPRLRGFC